jgi:hypothetical protein
LVIDEDDIDEDDEDISTDAMKCWPHRVLGSSRVVV